MSSCVCCGKYLPEGYGMVCECCCVDDIVKPKYKVGNTVYIAGMYDGNYYASKQPLLVEQIIITINRFDTKILYNVKCERYAEKVIEYMCFDSYEECKEWCDKHNSRKDI